MSQGIHSASPSYLITSGSNLDGDGVKVSTDGAAGDLLFLQADTTPQTSDSASVYEYKGVPEARAEFHPRETTGIDSLLDDCLTSLLKLVGESRNGLTVS